MPERPQVLHVDLMRARPSSSTANECSKHTFAGTDMIVQRYSLHPAHVCAIGDTSTHSIQREQGAPKRVIPSACSLVKRQPSRRTLKELRTKIIVASVMKIRAERC